jgi:hypothetical protein
MHRLKVKEDRLNLEMEEAHGDFGKTRLVLEKRLIFTDAII